MRLAARGRSLDPGLDATAGRIFDRRLRVRDPRPVAVALSGGGDSLAMLLTAADWARGAGRALVVLTVDHGLRPESAGWTTDCAAAAGRLGLAFRALAWTGDKPKTGLPATARAARHALLADAAREAGARVILLGHTADDVLEARLMRQAGSSTPEPREWSPSPAWPQGRGLFLLRPLLSVRRAEIRAWLSARGESWIDDPANEDAAYARPRARQALANGAEPGLGEASTAAASLALATEALADGSLRIDRALFCAAEPAAQARFLAAACVCAGGGARPPERAKTGRLAARLADEAIFTATLAGARIGTRAGTITFAREPGEAARGGLAPLSLRAGETAVWDGRFEVRTGRDVEISAAPGQVTPDASDPAADLASRPLTYERLLAACGAIEAEPL